MRITIQELMRTCNAIDESVHGNSPLTDEECEAVMTCIYILKTTVLPGIDDEVRLAVSLGSLSGIVN